MRGFVALLVVVVLGAVTLTYALIVSQKAWYDYYFSTYVPPERQSVEL